MMELVKPFQELQMHNIIEEATFIIFYLDSLNPCLAHLGMDNFNVDDYSIEVNNLVEISYFETILLLIKKYDPSPSPPIASLLESLRILEIKPLPDIPIDTLSIIPNQEAQLVNILKIHKKVIEYDISK